MSAVLSPGIKRWKREADHSPLRSAEIKNAWSFTFISHMCLHGAAVEYKNGFIRHLRMAMKILNLN